METNYSKNSRAHFYVKDKSKLAKVNQEKRQLDHTERCIGRNLVCLTSADKEKVDTIYQE